MEVSNANGEAIATLDFLTNEWLAFGNQLPRFIAAADREERCALLPLMAANLVLSMYSDEGHRAATQYLARAKALARDGADANDRERAWLAATEAWIDGDTDRSLDRLDQLTIHWPRDLLAGKLGQLHSFNRGCAQALLRFV